MQLEIQGKTIEQVMSFSYLGIQLSNNGILARVVRIRQSDKAAKTSAC